MLYFNIELELLINFSFDILEGWSVKGQYIQEKQIPKIEDLTRVVVSYEISETSFGEFHTFHMK